MRPPTRKKSTNNSVKDGGSSKAKAPTKGTKTPWLCLTCNKAIVEGEKTIECHGCRNWCHRKCMSLSDSQYSVLEQSDDCIQWICQECSSSQTEEPNRSRLEAKVDMLLKMIQTMSPRIESGIQSYMGKLGQKDRGNSGEKSSWNLWRGTREGEKEAKYHSVQLAWELKGHTRGQKERRRWQGENITAQGFWRSWRCHWTPSQTGKDTCGKEQQTKAAENGDQIRGREEKADEKCVPAKYRANTKRPNQENTQQQQQYTQGERSLPHSEGRNEKKKRGRGKWSGDKGVGGGGG